MCHIYRLEKAFDIVDHNILLQELRHYATRVIVSDRLVPLLPYWLWPINSNRLFAFFQNFYFLWCPLQLHARPLIIPFVY